MRSLINIFFIYQHEYYRSRHVAVWKRRGKCHMVAVPKGLIPDPDNPNQKIVTDPDIHVGYDNNSIFTAWSFSSTVAEGFAQGKDGKGQGVVLEKRVSSKNLIISEFSIDYFADDLEVLLPGDPKADDKYEVKKIK